LLTGHVDLQGAGVFVDQEREQADQRIDRRSSADDAGQSWRHAGRGLGDFPGEQDQRRFQWMAHRGLITTSRLSRR
jgi:hypothetical protein